MPTRIAPNELLGAASLPMPPMPSRLFAAPPVISGKVNPLVWVKGRAATPFGPYHVVEEDNDAEPFWFMLLSGKTVTKAGTFGSESGAKAAAQADCEDRARSLFQPGDGWQGIERAPRDGTEGDLWNAKTGRIPCCIWMTNSYGHTAWHFRLGGGRINVGDDTSFTYWMPLPAPPASMPQGEDAR